MVVVVVAVEEVEEEEEDAVVIIRLQEMVEGAEAVCKAAIMIVEELLEATIRGDDTRSGIKETTATIAIVMTRDGIERMNTVTDIATSPHEVAMTMVIGTNNDTSAATILLVARNMMILVDADKDHKVVHRIVNVIVTTNEESTRRQGNTIDVNDQTATTMATKGRGTAIEMTTVDTEEVERKEKRVVVEEGMILMTEEDIATEMTKETTANDERSIGIATIMTTGTGNESTRKSGDVVEVEAN